MSVSLQNVAARPVIAANVGGHEPPVQPNHWSSGNKTVVATSGTNPGVAGLAEPKQEMMARLQTVARDSQTFHRLFAESFGRSYDQSTAEGLRKQIIRGDQSWMPEVRFAPRSDLAGANGAYGQDGVVYLASDLKGKPTLAAATLTEEVGHHMDTLVNGKDTPGDEGEMFRRILGGENLSATQKTEIRAHDATGEIRVHGKTVEAEFFFGKIVKAVKKGVGKVGDFFSKAADKVGNFFSKIKDKLAPVLDKAFAIFDKIKPFVALIPGVGTAIAGIGSVLQTGWGVIRNGAKGAVGFLKQFAGGLVKSAANWATGLLGPSGSFLKPVVGAVVDTANASMPQGRQGGAAVQQGMKNIVQVLLSKLTTMFTPQAQSRET